MRKTNQLEHAGGKRYPATHTCGSKIRLPLRAPSRVGARQNFEPHEHNHHLWSRKPSAPNPWDVFSFLPLSPQKGQKGSTNYTHNKSAAQQNSSSVKPDDISGLLSCQLSLLSKAVLSLIRLFTVSEVTLLRSKLLGYWRAF